MDTDAHRKTMDTANPSESQPTLDANPNFPSLNWGEPKPLHTEMVTVGRSGNPCSAPMRSSSPGILGLPVPSQITTKKTRTNSTYEKAMDNPIEKGRIKYFCRGKGHGFIKNDRDGEEIFVHISDIEGEYVPKEGDEVTFRLCPIPPKQEKHQAIHVRIVNFTPEVHLKWNSPLYDHERCEMIQTFVVD